MTMRYMLQLIAILELIPRRNLLATHRHEVALDSPPPILLWMRPKLAHQHRKQLSPKPPPLGKSGEAVDIWSDKSYPLTDGV